MHYSQIYKQNGCELWVQSQSAYLRKVDLNCQHVTNNSHVQFHALVRLGSFLSPLRESRVRTNYHTPAPLDVCTVEYTDATHVFLLIRL